jgi:hypothetical protein
MIIFLMTSSQLLRFNGSHLTAKKVQALDECNEGRVQLGEPGFALANGRTIHSTAKTFYEL